MPERIAIIAAMEREIRPLVRSWEARPLDAGGVTLSCFQRDGVTALCAGIGPEAARRAAEAVIAHAKPQLVISAGFAGALESGIRVGTVIRPASVVESGSGRRFTITDGSGILVSSPEAVGPSRKRELGGLFRAQAVDMEAAAVAEVAARHGIGFRAVKAISDELEFRILDLSRFVDGAGQLHTGRLLGFVAVRPARWPTLLRLAQSSRLAAARLCRALSDMLREQQHGDATRETQAPSLLEPRLH